MSHEPKWRALIAYDSDALSDAGRARLHAHLAGCDTCREALASVQAFDQVAAEIRTSSVPELDFESMDAVLAAEAKAASERTTQGVVTPGPARWFGVAAVLTAAAAAVFLWLQTEPPSQPEVAQQQAPTETTPQAETPAAREELAGEVTAVAGVVSGNGSTLGLGDAIDVGSRVSIEGAGALHVRLADGTAFGLESDAGASATLRQAFDGEIQVELHSGRSTHRVRTGTHYDVLAGEYTVRVRGTHFEVLHLPDDGVAVILDEGTVEVLRGETLLETLQAPARWSSSAGRIADDSEVTVGALVASAQGEVTDLSADTTEEGTLTLPADANIVRWLAGSLTLPGVQGLHTSLRVPLGEIEVIGYEADGTQRTATLMVTEQGSSLAETDLSNVRARRSGYLAPEVISEVVRPSFRTLRRCYERELRNIPELSGQYSLRVSVTRNGSVSNARVITRDDLPPPMQNCFVQQAESWQFPPPQGGAMTFDLPLSLSTAN